MGGVEGGGLFCECYLVRRGSFFAETQRQGPSHPVTLWSVVLSCSPTFTGLRSSTSPFTPPHSKKTNHNGTSELPSSFVSYPFQAVIEGFRSPGFRRYSPVSNPEQYTGCSLNKASHRPQATSVGTHQFFFLHGGKKPVASNCPIAADGQEFSRADLLFLIPFSYSEAYCGCENRSPVCYLQS